ncbi:MAG TPA: tRNA (adenosine(37)-N6)-threonylcarbamoyltransferase complex ATPase subunit type 1 TsaE [Dongiaceae bacterium]|nr:tRNA (adenosine(37)-N6)-threonylcarbamoyltransferase complex ATPase subunit type 1 TsaE [Dongiaceae bacterium]
MIIEVHNETETKALAETIGRSLKGGEVFELVGDVGAGKTTFVKGLARGLLVHDDVQSPSFTISRVYDARDGLQLAHYDFYRLQEPGIMADELREVVHDPTTVTVIEWAAIVEGVLPETRYTIRFESPTETDRRLAVSDSLKELV